MKLKIIGAIALILILATSLYAATLSIDFDGGNPIGMRVSTGGVLLNTSITNCGANNCLRGTASGGGTGQRLESTVIFSSQVNIVNISFDYKILVNAPSTQYAGGTVSLTVMDGGIYRYSGTPFIGLINDGQWHSLTTAGVTNWTNNSRWDGSHTANLVRIGIFSANGNNAGSADIQIDNIVIEYN